MGAGVTFKTYEVVRPSADELIVYAHPFYLGLLAAAVAVGLAIYFFYKAKSTGTSSPAPLPLLLLALCLGVPAGANFGKMTFNKASNTFVAERTRWFIPSQVSTTLDDVDHARLNQANTTYQLCIVLRSRSGCVPILALDSAGGQDDAARDIDRFLMEFYKGKVHREPGEAGQPVSGDPERP